MHDELDILANHVAGSIGVRVEVDLNVSYIGHSLNAKTNQITVRSATGVITHIAHLGWNCGG